MIELGEERSSNLLWCSCFRNPKETAWYKGLQVSFLASIWSWRLWGKYSLLWHSYFSINLLMDKKRTKESLWTQLLPLPWHVQFWVVEKKKKQWCVWKWWFTNHSRTCHQVVANDVVLEALEQKTHSMVFILISFFLLLLLNGWLKNKKAQCGWYADSLFTRNECVWGDYVVCCANNFW